MSETDPVVTKDPRFEAGRSLIKQGMAQDGAIEIFSTLVEECIAKYGESSIETAPAFFEYGNSLLRSSLAEAAEDQAAEEEEEQALAEAAKTEPREAARLAAESRLRQQEDGDQKLPAKSEADTINGDVKQEIVEGENEKEEDDEAEQDEEGGNDLDLALEMMENAFSILDEYYEDDETKEPKKYVEWGKEQWPRVLLGIGDCLSAMTRHSDAADAYSRALELRQGQLESLKSTENLELLQAHRRVCEATVLIAEELLACPPDEDVVTSETNSLVVKAGERIEYARGYYDKARDSLQETVYMMGKLAAKGVELGTEKEDVCFLATMIMGVGENLAGLDDQAESTSEGPAKKKAKVS